MRDVIETTCEAIALALFVAGLSALLYGIGGGIGG